MRSITKLSIEAFYNTEPFKLDNTEVKVLPNVTILILFGNEIAYRYNDPERTLSITTCGYKTVTTKERLNGLNGVHIQQIKKKWYLNGELWDGNLINI